MDDEWEKIPRFGLCQTAQTTEANWHDVWDACSVTSAQDGWEDDWEDDWETGSE